MKDLNAEYEAAKQRIEDLRSVSWSSGYKDYNICGIKVKPLTVQAWIDLRAIKNPILDSSVNLVKYQDIANYLWRNSVHYSSKRTLLSDWRYWKIERTVKKCDVSSSVLEHIEDAFEECPNEVSDRSYFRSNGVPKIDDITFAISEIAHHYGQMPHNITNIPMLHLFQLQKAVRLSTIPGYKLAEPNRIHKINSQILERLNNG